MHDSRKQQRPLDGAEFDFDGETYRYLVFDHTPPVDVPGLTEAELDVAWRSANGESHEAVAKARGTSTSTVANQLASVFSKLCVTSRAELAHALTAIESD